MSIVNNILNMVKLNTTDYNKKLQKMRKDTKKSTRDIGSSFSSMASAWKAALVGIASAGLVTAVKSELMSTEKAVAGFISSMGGVSEARAQFEMLQQAARDTLQPFEALQSATMNLRKNGIQPSADTLKAFSQIAYGTGQSLDAVSQAFTGALNGRLKSLQQLGIVAKDQGSQLILTYKGVSTAVDKNAESLHDYFQTIGKENEGVLDYLQSGMTGAVNHIDNAWGDLVRAVAESGLGDLISTIIRDIASSMDEITGWITKNSPYFKSFFEGVIEGWKGIYGAVKSAVSSGIDLISGFFDDATEEEKDGLSNMGILLSNFFEFARAGFMEYVAKPAAEAWGSISGGFKAVGEAAGTLAFTGSWDAAVKNYNNVLNQTADDTIETVNVINKAITLQFDEIDKKVQKTKERLSDKSSMPDFTKIKFLSPTGTGGAGGAGGKSQADTWAKYYQSVKDLAKNGLSDLRKLELEHQTKLLELDKEFKQSRVATEAQYLDAKSILDAEYMRQYQEIQAQAQEYVHDIIDDDLTKLRESYDAKIEMLEMYHEESLISDEEFLEARNKLWDDYSKERDKIDSGKSVLSEEDVQNLTNFHDAMDSMSDAFGNLTQGLSETSSSYKALFTIQKSFAVASATVKAALAWMTALSGASTWYEAIANYATAISMTTGVIAQLRSVSMHDKGGYIGAGQLGIVGEYGPELVRGPASVTSRQRTADLARSAISGNTVTVNLYENRDRAGTVDQRQGRDGESIIDIFVSNIRRGGQIAQTMESTYQLKRYGA